MTDQERWKIADLWSKGYTDPQIAEELPYYEVNYIGQVRRSMGMGSNYPAHIEKQHKELFEKMDPVIRSGKYDDTAIARMMGIAVVRVKDRRKELGIENSKRAQQKMIEQYIVMHYGEMNDSQIGRELHVSPTCISAARRRLGIPTLYHRWGKINNRKDLQSPCTECQVRYEACHDSCTLYKEWKAKQPKHDEVAKGIKDQRVRFVNCAARRCHQKGSWRYGK